MSVRDTETDYNPDIIQLYAHWSDLVPAEQGFPVNEEPYKSWLASMRDLHAKHGPSGYGSRNMQGGRLKIKPCGWIADGNFRFETRFEFGIEYFPVDLNFFTGLYKYQTGPHRPSDGFLIRKELLEKVPALCNYSRQVPLQARKVAPCILEKKGPLQGLQRINYY